MSDARQVALNILTEFDKRHSNLNDIIDREFRRTDIDSRDKRLVHEIVYGVIRRLNTLDYFIKYFLDNEKLFANRLLRSILRIGIYQIVFLDKIPAHAAVNEAVKLAKKYELTLPLAGVVNALLRNIIRNCKKLPYPDTQSQVLQRLELEYSHPKWMIERWLKQFGLSCTKQLLIYNNQRPSIYLRRKIHGISKQQFETETRGLCDYFGGYLNLYYKLRKSIVPDKIHIFKEGYCTVQNPSSGWIVALMDIAPGDRILDMCSAPGGKTSLCAELVGNQGAVYASDISIQRIYKVVETCRRMGLSTIFPLVCDGRHLPFDANFNKILIDAPCSATGVIQHYPEAKWIKNKEDVKKFSTLQSELLYSASSMVRPGGIIVYSTCSLEPEENEEVVGSFLERYPNFILESPPPTIPRTYVGIDSFVRIMPFEHKLDGMFGARLKRIR